MKMDYETPDHLLYTDSHEWIRRDPDNPNLITIGITDYAQDHVGDVVFLDYQVEDEPVEAGDVCAEIESTKTVADLYTPVRGEVVAVNRNLEDQPGLVNTSPYDEGWMVQVQVAEESNLDGLLDAAGYLSFLETN